MFGKVVGVIVGTRFPIDNELLIGNSVTYPIYFMSIDLVFLGMTVIFAMPLAMELSVLIGVGGCGCFIYRRVVRRTAASWQLWNSAAISDSAAESRKFLIRLQRV